MVYATVDFTTIGALVWGPLLLAFGVHRLTHMDKAVAFWKKFGNGDNRRPMQANAVLFILFGAVITAVGLVGLVT